MGTDKSIDISLGSSNVFADLGFDATDAANLKVRADLMLDLRNYIKSQSWTQEQAAAFFGETQPRISNLVNGEISRFSVDKLINMLDVPECRSELKFCPRHFESKCCRFGTLS
jgi:predicted XRE-type DNA-binding protein